MKRKTLAVIVAAAAVALSAGCGQATPTPTPRPPTPTAVPSPPVKKTFQYTATKIYTQEEFQALVDEAERRAAEASGLTASISTLEAEITKLTGSPPSVKYLPAEAFQQETKILQQEGIHTAGTYESTTNETFILKREPEERMMYLAHAGRITGLSPSEAEFHERLHAKQDRYTPQNEIDDLFGSNSIFYCQLTNPQLSPIVMSKDDCRSLKTKVFQAEYRHGIFWTPDIPAAEREQLLSAYAEKFRDNDQTEAGLQAAGKDLAEKLNLNSTVSLAKVAIWETQAFYAVQAAAEVDEDDKSLELKLQEILNNLNPEMAEQHKQYIDPLVRAVASGYATLKKAGVTGTEAHSRMAELVGKAGAPGPDPFGPYVAFNAGVDDLAQQLGVPQPSEADITAALRDRRDEIRERAGKMEKVTKDLLGERVIKPYIDFIVGPQLQRIGVIGNRANFTYTILQVGVENDTNGSAADGKITLTVNFTLSVN